VPSSSYHDIMQHCKLRSSQHNVFIAICRLQDMDAYQNQDSNRRRAKQGMYANVVLSFPHFITQLRSSRNT
jgi:hypothetical protein